MSNDVKALIEAAGKLVALAEMSEDNVPPSDLWAAIANTKAALARVEQGPRVDPLAWNATVDDSGVREAWTEDGTYLAVEPVPGGWMAHVRLGGGEDWTEAQARDAAERAAGLRGES